MEQNLQITSEKSPIYADLIPQADTKFKGSLGMTFAPGKNAISTITRSFWKRNIDLDLMQLKEKYQLDLLVTLMEDWELEEFKISNLKDKCQEYKIENVQFPIRDGQIPKNFQQLQDLISKINSYCNEGKNVIIHCRGGLGRTGTVAACCVIQQLKCPAKVAIDLVRKSRKGAIENQIQEDFVINFSKTIS